MVHPIRRVRFIREPNCLLLGLITWLMAGVSFSAAIQQQEKKPPARASSDSDDEPPESVAVQLSDEEQQQVKIAQRFMEVLEKNPRRGTALDRVYSHHIEFGSIDAWIKSLRERASKSEPSADRSVAYMLLGLIETNRGQFDQAVEALKQAELLRPDDPLASYYLGLAQASAGDSVAAAESLEKAIARSPQRTDLQEIYQQLVRVHLRAQRVDEAIAASQRLEQLFPKDVRILEQIAATMLQEERYEPAKELYEKLLKLVRDDYQLATIRIALADISIKLGEKAAGIQQLEKLLETLKPDSWIFLDVRRRIDQCFLISKDQAGLVAYYEEWLSRHPEDLDGMSRLSRYLNSVARVEEARRWAQKAVEVAPSRADVRVTLIQLLVESNEFKLAEQHYSKIVELEPANVDHRRNWGILVMKDSSRSIAERQESALAIWRKQLEQAPKDALLVSQIADLCRQHNILKPAEELYRSAVERQPNDVQYREYLGEFLHQQKRSEEALSVWSESIDGDRRTAHNLARVAEVYKAHGFKKESLSAIAGAVELDPKDFALQINAAKFHRTAGEEQESLTFLKAAESLASNDNELDTVISETIRTLKLTGDLGQVAARMQKELSENASPTSKQYYTMARMWEAAGQWRNAELTILKLINIEPNSIQAMQLSARVAESQGDKELAAQRLRQLATHDRRNRSSHLMQLSSVELGRGNNQAAYEAAKQLVVSAPNNSSNYQFFAQTCLKIGKIDEGLQAFRKAVRIDPGELGLLLSLAKSFSENGKTKEAIELYYRAYDKAEQLDDKLNIVADLTRIHRAESTVDQLVQNLRSDDKDPEKYRISVLSIAQAWRTAGSPEKAIEQLEKLHSPTVADTFVLQQLAKLCKETKNLSGAIKYQRQLVSVAPGSETEMPLAEMLDEVGEIEESHKIYRNAVLKNEDPETRLEAIDALLARRSGELVVSVTTQILKENPDDWEMIYRRAIALYLSSQFSEAHLEFKRLLYLGLDKYSPGCRESGKSFKTAEDEWQSIVSALTSARVDSSLLNNRNTPSSTTQPFGPSTANRRVTASRSPRKFYSPSHYEFARIASLVWLQKLTVPREKYDEKIAAQTLKDLANRAASPEATLQDATDQFYLRMLNADSNGSATAARKLATIGGELEGLAFLHCLYQQRFDGVTPTLISSSSAQGQVQLQLQIHTQSSAAPKLLSEAELKLALEVYNRLCAETRKMWMPQNNPNFRVVQALGSIPAQSRRSLNIVTLSEFLFDAMIHSNQTGLADELAETVLRGEDPGQLMQFASMLLDNRQPEPSLAFIRKWSNVYQTLLENSNAQLSIPADEIIQAQTILTYCHQQNLQDMILEMVQLVLPLLAESSYVNYKSQAISKGMLQFQLNPQSAGLGQPPQALQYPLVFRSDCSFLADAYRSLASVNRHHEIEDFISRKSSQRRLDVGGFSWDIYLANIQYWKGDFEASLELLLPISQIQLVQHATVSFALIDVYRKLGRNSDALEIATELQVTDNESAIQRAELIIEIALAIGDKELAVRTAKELLSRSLSIDEQVQLLGQLSRLNMNVEVENMRKKLLGNRHPAALQGNLAQSARLRINSARAQLNQGLPAVNQTNPLILTIPSTPSSFPQGTESVSNSVAHETQAAHFLENSRCLFDSQEVSVHLLQRALVRTSLSNEYSYLELHELSSSEKPQTEKRSQHDRAMLLVKLHDSGKLVDRIKTLIEKASMAEATSVDKALVIESQIFAGDKQSAINGLREMLKSEPESRAYRFILAELLCELRDEAGFEMFLELLKHHSAWMFSTKNPLILQVNWKSDQLIPLANALLAIDPYILKSNKLTMTIARSLLRQSQEPQQFDLCLSLLEHLAKAYVQDANALVSQFVERDGWLWKEERFYRMIESLMLPSADNIKINPKTGINAFDVPRPTLIDSEVSTLYSRGGGAFAQSPIEANPTQANLSTSFFQRFTNSLVRHGRVKQFSSTLEKHLELYPDWHVGKIYALALHASEKDRDWMQIVPLLDKPEITEIIPEAVCDALLRSVGENQRDVELKLIELAARRRFYMAGKPELVDRLKEMGMNSQYRSRARKLLKSIISMSESVDRLVAIADALSQLGYHLDATNILCSLEKSLKKSTVTNASGADPNSARSLLVRSSLTLQLKKCCDRADVETAEEQLLEVQNANLVEHDLNTMLMQSDETWRYKMLSPEVEQMILGGQEVRGEQLVAKLNELRNQFPLSLKLAVLDAAWKVRSKKYSAEEVLESVQKAKRLLVSKQWADQSSKLRSQSWIVASALIQAQEYWDHAELQEIGNELAEHSISADEEKGVLTKNKTAILLEWARLLAERNDIAAAEEKWQRIIESLNITHRPPASSVVALRQFEVALLFGIAKEAQKHGLDALRVSALSVAIENLSPYLLGASLREWPAMLHSLTQPPYSKELFAKMQTAVFPPNASQHIYFLEQFIEVNPGDPVSLPTILMDYAKKLGELEKVEKEIESRKGDELNQLAMYVLMRLAQDRKQDVPELLDKLSDELNTPGLSLRRAFPLYVARQAAKIDELKEHADKVLKKLRQQ